MAGKRAAPEDLQRALTNATGKVATWQEVDLIKDHIAALEETLEGIRACLPKYRRGDADWVRCAESSIEVCNHLEEANRQYLPDWSPGDSPAEVVAYLVNQIEDWKSRWQAEDEGARAAREALQVEREQWRQEKERLQADIARFHGLSQERMEAAHRAEIRKMLEQVGDAERLAEQRLAERNGVQVELEQAHAELARLKPSGQVAEERVTEALRERDNLHVLLTQAEDARTATIADAVRRALCDVVERLGFDGASMYRDTSVDNAGIANSLFHSVRDEEERTVKGVTERLQNERDAAVAEKESLERKLEVRKAWDRAAEACLASIAEVVALGGDEPMRVFRTDGPEFAHLIDAVRFNVEGRKTAVADNAAMGKAVETIAAHNGSDCLHQSPTECVYYMVETARAVTPKSHPGAALLERHRREVENAWDYGLEEAARHLEVFFEQPTMAAEIRAKQHRATGRSGSSG